MGDVLTFRPRATVEYVLPTPSPAETRRMIKEAAQTTLDTADSLLAILDRMDGDADTEDGRDAEPSLAAPENYHESQVVWLRGGDADYEAEAPEIVLPGVPAEVSSLPWRGSGNVVAAVGVAFLDMVGRR